MDLRYHGFCIAFAGSCQKHGSVLVAADSNISVLAMCIALYSKWKGDFSEVHDLLVESVYFDVPMSCWMCLRLLRRLPKLWDQDAYHRVVAPRS